jgi:hypothetical protein
MKYSLDPADKFDLMWFDLSWLTELQASGKKFEQVGSKISLLNSIWLWVLYAVLKPLHSPTGT